MSVRIERCVCFDVAFEELRALADAEDVADVASLQKLREFGRQCGLCLPYVREMLRTGQVVFKELLPEND